MLAKAVCPLFIIAHITINCKPSLFCEGFPISPANSLIGESTKMNKGWKYEPVYETGWLFSTLVCFYYVISCEIGGKHNFSGNTQ